MAGALRADASAGQAYVEFTLGVAQPEVWLTMQMSFDAAALAIFSGSYGGNFTVVLTAAGAYGRQFVYIDPTGWHDFNFADGPPAPTADVWHTVEMHYLSGGTIDLYVDGSLQASGPEVNGGDIDTLQVGLTLDTADPAYVAYFDDVTLGTTRGGSDLFSDDFESGDLSAWTSTIGDVTIVEDPFAPFTLPVFFVAFDDPTLEPNPTWTQVG